MLIYKITNLINNKVFIGLTINQIKNVKDNHRASIKLGKGSPLFIAMKKYGEDNFRYTILKKLKETQSVDELYHVRKKFIREYDSTDIDIGYNCQIPAPGSRRYHHVDLVKEKLSYAHTGKVMSQEFKDNLSKVFTGPGSPNWGRKHTKKAIKNMRLGQLNSDYVPSEETKKKTSDTMKKRWQEPTEQMLKDAYNKKHQIGSRDIRGKNNPMYGVIRKGKDNPMYGKRAWNRGIPMTEEQKKKLKEGREKFQMKKRKELLEKYSKRTEKKCCKCKNVKSLDMFDKNKANLDGYFSTCKPCERKRGRERYYRLRSPNKVRNRYGKLIKDVIKGG